MNNNHYPSPSRKLPTNRSFLIFFLRALCSFCILYIVDAIQMSQDLRTITEKYTSKRPGLLFFDGKTCKLINAEIARRGLNFKKLRYYDSVGMVNALNLLAADYNING